MVFFDFDAIIRLNCHTNDNKTICYFKKLLKHGITCEMVFLRHTGPVARAGETAGGVRVRLDFLFLFSSRKKEKENIDK
jgi:hypothetical protein